MNKVCLTGRATKDIELRYTTNSVAVSSFTIAVNRNYKNENGDYETDFINCVAYRKTAELLNSYVKKGDMLGIEGSVRTRNYDDKDGKKVYVTEIMVDSVDFLQSKKEVEKAVEEEQKPVEVDPYKDFGEQIVITDDDLPF